MYKQASQLGLRFQTTKGILSVEQLWQLNQTDLSNSIKHVKKILKKDNDDELSFLEDTNTVDVENQLRFDILKDVYITKKKANEEARLKAERKSNNQKIIELIARKQDAELEGKSIAELEALLKEE